MSFTDGVNLGTNCVKFEKTFHCSNPISNHLLQISKCRELRVFGVFFATKNALPDFFFTIIKCGVMMMVRMSRMDPSSRLHPLHTTEKQTTSHQGFQHSN